MGRRGGKFGHRRTVLQLDDDKEPSYGFGKNNLSNFSFTHFAKNQTFLVSTMTY